VCYKRYMRKWIGDRIKRRKKGGGKVSREQAAAAAPEPLQPKYFENDVGGGEKQPPVEPPPSERRPETQADFKLTSSARPTHAAPAPTAEGGPRATRRRRRGGRGSRAGARRSSAPQTVAGEAAPAETQPYAPLSQTSFAEAPPESIPEAAQQAPPLTPSLLTPEPVPVGEPSPGPVSALGPAPVPPASAATGGPSAVVPERPSKGIVILAIGLPGSGKSSWFKRHNIHPLSSDLLRELLFDDAQEQRFQDLVFSNLRSMLKARLIARRPMNYVDATNLTPHDRHSWIKLAKDYGYEVQGLFFDVPLEVCLERHKRRGRVVPEDIMRRMAQKLRPPTFEEGFSKLTVVRVKQKDAAAS